MQKIVHRYSNKISKVLRPGYSPFKKLFCKFSKEIII